jgi:hypothetical protein
MIRRLWVHTAAALAVMLGASLVAAVLLPADADFLLHVAGRTAGRGEALFLLPLMAVLLAAFCSVRQRGSARPTAEWPLPLLLVHFLSFVHLNVVISGFQRSAAGTRAAWSAALAVLAVGLATVLAAVRARTAHEERRTATRTRRDDAALAAVERSRDVGRGLAVGGRWAGVASCGMAHTDDPRWLARMVACVDLVLARSGAPPDAATAHGASSWATLRASLAAANLGLVEIARPEGFAWPGYWIAVAATEDGLEPVVMYGAPSARIWPRDVGGDLVHGYVLAPFDPSLPARQPYGTTPAHAGRVTGLFVATDAGAPMQAVPAVEAIAGTGLEGDRYAAGRGTFDGPVGYEVTLVDARACDDLTVDAGELRRNVVTAGIDLNALVGERFRVGDALLVGRRLCEPCRHLENLLGTRVIGPLVHRAGLRADILESGPVALGDPVMAIGGARLG